MAEWLSETIAANDLQLHYYRTGGNKPSLVLAHGFSDDGLCWTPVARVLESEYDILMVDARGHGRSEDPEEGYGTRAMAEDLAAVIQQLGIERPAMMGHSMGAATVMALAGLYPEMPRAILLEDPPARWADPDGGSGARSDEWRVRTRRHLVALKRKLREEMIAEQRTLAPSWTQEELGPWADAKLRLSFNVLQRGGTEDLDLQATMRQIRCPVLLLTADPERGSIVSPVAAESFQKLVPQTRLVHLPGAGHSIHREQFGPFMDAVGSFLKDTLS